MQLLKTLDEAFERLLKWGWRNRKALAACLAVLVAAWAVGGGEEPEPAPELASAVLAEEGEPLGPALFDRLWVDKLPRNRTDTFRMYFFLKRHPIGVHLTFHSMTWRVQEFFEHEVKGGAIRFHFMDPELRPHTKAKLEGMKHDAFDMKMTMATDPQAKGTRYTYYRLKQQAAQDLLAAWGVSVEGLKAALPAR